ncbi:MAG: hypothetical protein ABMA64_39965 [Myxococcota bacterium]
MASDYGAVRRTDGVRPEAFGGSLVMISRAFPSAGRAGLRLRLIESFDEAQTAPEREDPDHAAPEPGASLMWLGDVYSLVARSDPDSAIDVLFEQVDDLLSAGEFNRCDALLKTIDPKRLDSNLLVAALSITKRAADRLPERQAFVRRVTARLMEVAPDRLERLLSGLV